MDAMHNPINDQGFLSRPRWLDEEPLPRDLLDRFLTKLEKGQRLSLRITPKTAPQLYDFQNEDVKYLWALVKSLDKEFHILNIKIARTKPGQEVYEDAQVYFVPEQEELVRHWLNRPALDPYALVWQDELAKMKEQFEDYGQALFEKMVRVPEQGPERTLRAFARMGKELQHPVTLRALSARCFWGDSKFLDRSEDLVRELFPSVAHNLLPRPILMAVHLPRTIEQILFIENQDTFIALAQRNLTGYALVYSAGFRGSALRIRESGNALFSYLNPMQHEEALRQFQSWWFNEKAAEPDVKCFFWGDLDFAGMAILKALRQTFPDINAWQPGYQPLLERLRDGWGHTQDSAGKSLQKDPDLTGCEYADLQLLPAMRDTETFIDQEAVNVMEVELRS